MRGEVSQPKPEYVVGLSHKLCGRSRSRSIYVCVTEKAPGKVILRSETFFEHALCVSDMRGFCRERERAPS